MTGLETTCLESGSREDRKGGKGGEGEKGKKEGEVIQKFKCLFRDFGREYST